MSKSWTPEEDALLVELIHKFGAQKWTFISEHLQGRIGKRRNPSTIIDLDSGRVLR